MHTRSRRTAGATTILLFLTGAAPAFAQSSSCKGGIVSLGVESTIDLGWAGNAHDDELVAGASFGFFIARRCASGGQTCAANADCGGSACVATCDCASDTSCEIMGPAGEKRCRDTLEPCEDSSACAAGAPCVTMSSPPLPMSNGELPVCIVSSFDAPLTGTIDTASGAATLSTALRWRVFFGITIDAPCPVCGAPSENPRVGDVFECVGGASSGEACTVHGVTEQFGGLSFDCPPSTTANVSGSGVSIRFDELTTGTVTRTAELPCGSIGFRANPLNAPEDPGVCLDDKTSCDSNADCTRCTGDSTIACDDDGDCAGNGTCAEAPDQPISCGHWCHCGFCSGDTTVACFDESDCPDGQQCQRGEGPPHTASGPQQRPNECVHDAFVCGELANERCATTDRGECSEEPFRECDPASDLCEDFGAGECVLEARACFEPRITRSGQVSALGSYCALSLDACENDAGCTGPGDVCVDDALAPDLIALTCSPGTASAPVNRDAGITGPVALELETLIRLCRCTNDDPEDCEDLCSALPGCDPDTDPGCTPLCGDWTGNGVLQVSDALGVLQAAIGVHSCAPSVCDFDGDGEVTALDALAVLRAAVSLPANPACPSGGANAG